MTEPETNTTNAVTFEDDNPEQHTGDRIPDHTEESGDQPGNAEDEQA